MPRNVEIKACVRNPLEFQDKIGPLVDAKPANFYQRDIFFTASNGRLKLRYQTGKEPELIFYNRGNTSGPKLSDYKIVTFSVDQADKMELLLGDSNGIIGEVKKTRFLYNVGQTRIHLDKVEGLGDFVEFEVVLEPQQSVSEGQDIARMLMQKLEIAEEDLIDCAYMDLIAKKLEKSL